MTNLDVEVTEAQEVDPIPTDGGQVGDAPSLEVDQAPPPEPTYDYLDIDDSTAAKHVKITREGQEVSVPLKEVLDGYNSNSVATQRFQEAAAMREQAQEALRLQQAFQTSPGLTVQVLAQQAGMSVEDFLGLTPRQQQAAVESPPAPDEYADPLEKMLHEERAARIKLEQRLDQEDADKYLRSQIEGLKQTYQIDDDAVRNVVQQALSMGVGPEAFPMIYQSQAFLKLQAQTGAQQEYAATQAAEDAKRRAAAAAASGVVTSGSAQPAVTTAPPADTHLSPRQAVEAAFAQLEGR